MAFGAKYQYIIAIKERTDNLPDDPASEAEVEAAIAAAHAVTDAVIVAAHVITDGKVDAVQSDVTAVKERTDNLPDDPASESEVEAAITTAHATTDAEIQKAVTKMDFWSDQDDVIDLPAAAADTDLPNVVVAGLPSGISLVRVVAMLKVRAIENTSATGANAIQGAQAIRVKKSTTSWGAGDLAAIDLPDNLWTVALSTRESGDVLIGDNDVKDEVDGNATYNLRFENALVDYANLRLNDVMVGLRFYFTTS